MQNNKENSERLSTEVACGDDNMSCSGISDDIIDDGTNESSDYEERRNRVVETPI